MGRVVDAGNPMQEWMQFQLCDVRSPEQSPEVVDQNVIDVRTALVPRHRKRFHPFRGEAGRILLIKSSAENTVRIPFQGDWPIPEVRQKIWRDLPIVIRDV